MPDSLRSEGSLVERDFPDLVHVLYERNFTGSLLLTRAGLGKSVTIEQGRLVFASSSDPDERLGELQLRRGRISLRDYVEAGKAVGPGRRLGTLLVERGVLGPKELVKAVVEHTQEIIYGAFLWTDGRYRLQEGQRSVEAITLNISTPDLIVEGIRRIDSWTRVARAVGSLESAYARAAGYEAVVAKMSLTDGQLEILTSMSGPQTLDALCDGSILPAIEVCRALWAYRVIGLVRRLDAPETKDTALEDDGLGEVLGKGDHRQSCDHPDVGDRRNSSISLAQTRSSACVSSGPAQVPPDRRRSRREQSPRPASSSLSHSSVR